MQRIKKQIDEFSDTLMDINDIRFILEAFENKQDEDIKYFQKASKLLIALTQTSLLISVITIVGFIFLTLIKHNIFGVYFLIPFVVSSYFLVASRKKYKSYFMGSLHKRLELLSDKEVDLQKKHAACNLYCK